MKMWMRSAWIGLRSCGLWEWCLFDWMNFLHCLRFEWCIFWLMRQMVWPGSINGKWKFGWWNSAWCMDDDVYQCSIFWRVFGAPILNPSSKGVRKYVHPWWAVIALYIRGGAECIAISIPRLMICMDKALLTHSETAELIWFLLICRHTLHAWSVLGDLWEDRLWYAFEVTLTFSRFCWMKGWWCDFVCTLRDCMVHDIARYQGPAMQKSFNKWNKQQSPHLPCWWEKSPRHVGECLCLSPVPLTVLVCW